MTGLSRDGLWVWVGPRTAVRPLQINQMSRGALDRGRKHGVTIASHPPTSAMFRWISPRYRLFGVHPHGLHRRSAPRPAGGTQFRSRWPDRKPPMLCWRTATAGPMEGLTYGAAQHRRADGSAVRLPAPTRAAHRRAAAPGAPGRQGAPGGGARAGHRAAAVPGRRGTAGLADRRGRTTAARPHGSTGWCVTTAPRPTTTCSACARPPRRAGPPCSTRVSWRTGAGCWSWSRHTTPVWSLSTDGPS